VKKNDVVPAYKFKSNWFVGMDLQAIETILKDTYIFTMNKGKHNKNFIGLINFNEIFVMF